VLDWSKMLMPANSADEQPRTPVKMARFAVQIASLTPSSDYRDSPRLFFTKAV
jgi:hypothetical protein